MGRKSRRKKDGGRGQGAGTGRGAPRRACAGHAQGGASGGLPPVMDRRAMEKTMADLHRLLAQHDFADLEEANRFLAGLTAEGGGGIPAGQATTPLEEAQDLMYEAWEATAPPAARRKALDISPDCADAYVLLAEGRPHGGEARLLRPGVAAGERALGADMFEEDAGHFWGILETRPYMRAREGLARCLWELGERQEAISHYRRCCG